MGDPSRLALSELGRSSPPLQLQQERRRGGERPQPARERQVVGVQGRERCSSVARAGVSISTAAEASDPTTIRRAAALRRPLKAVVIVAPATIISSIAIARACGMSAMPSLCQHLLVRQYRAAACRRFRPRLSRS
jgi:hypothetical protein